MAAAVCVGSGLESSEHAAIGSKAAIPKTRSTLNVLRTSLLNTPSFQPEPESDLLVIFQVDVITDSFGLGNPA